jgi:pimeloyl-ACP methyl ester carboxylesterase
MSILKHIAAAGLLFACAVVPASAAPAIKNIVLVHGAFVDGSGWKSVYDILIKHGYHVTLVQQPLTSLEDDVAAANRVLDRQDGPCVLVGHSYGGAVITEAGTNPHVAALVYIAAHAPDEGETEAANGKRFPNSIRPLVKTPDDFVFLDPANFAEDFAADLPKAQAEFMAHAQMPTAAKVFTTPITNPAWKLKPSWYMVAGADKTINPDLERMYSARTQPHGRGQGSQPRRIHLAAQESRRADRRSRSARSPVAASGVALKESVVWFGVCCSVGFFAGVGRHQVQPPNPRFKPMC